MDKKEYAKIDAAMSRMSDEEAAAFLDSMISDKELRKNSVPVTEKDWKEMLDLADELKKLV